LKLHDYQKYCVEFIKENPISALFLDCGLGKTVTTLTAINDLMYDYFEVRKVLIIAPLRVARDTWSDEIKKWKHLKNLTCSVAVGNETERKNALKSKADLYIINRENIHWLIAESGIEFDFDMLVIDELSSFKNHQTKRFKSLLKIRPKVKRIVGLTGTPASNGLMDLWAEFRLLDMGERLGKFIGNYRNTYFQPDKRNGMIIYSYKPLPDSEDKIYDRISDITISMKSTDYLNMPKLIHTERLVKLSENEFKHYNDMKRDLVLNLSEDEITASNAASLSNKLSQIANGAIYNEDGDMIKIHDRKLDALEDLIEEANGKSVLVAYWFKHDFKRISERLDALKISFCTMDTSENIRRWNAGKIPVALIHPASAGHGLNIQSGGSCLVWFGLTWSLELYQQTNARLWRQGQKSETVVIHHIVAEKTIDERILTALSQKEKIQDSLIEAVKAELNREEN
jgi:SNF2 family DNA or RNA helicase